MYNTPDGAGVFVQHKRILESNKSLFARRKLGETAMVNYTIEVTVVIGGVKNKDCVS